jgi:hypothetical protein
VRDGVLDGGADFAEDGVEFHLTVVKAPKGSTTRTMDSNYLSVAEFAVMSHPVSKFYAAHSPFRRMTMWQSTLILRVCWLSLTGGYMTTKNYL